MLSYTYGVIEMINKNVAYIKSHVQRDLEISQRITDKDFSADLGIMLNVYLAYPPDKVITPLIGAFYLGELEEKVKSETGKRPTFHETTKCGLKIHLMWKEGDEEGLAEIQRYANELVGRGLE